MATTTTAGTNLYRSSKALQVKPHLFGPNGSSHRHYTSGVICIRRLRLHPSVYRPDWSLNRVYPAGHLFGVGDPNPGCAPMHLRRSSYKTVCGHSPRVVAKKALPIDPRGLLPRMLDSEDGPAGS
jgi:hypothetical protein